MKVETEKHIGDWHVYLSVDTRCKATVKVSHWPGEWRHEPALDIEVTVRD